MATTKTIQPTGTTITIPAMTDKPDASVFATDVSRITDAVNAQNSNFIDLQSKMRPSFYEKNDTSVTVTGVSGGRYIIFVISGNATRGAMIIGGITANGIANIGMSDVGSGLTVSTDGASYIITAPANTYFQVLVFTTSSNSHMPTFS